MWRTTVHKMQTVQFKRQNGCHAKRQRRESRANAQTERKNLKKQIVDISDQTCVPPLVSFELVRAGKPASTVCEVTLVGFLPWTQER